MKKYLLYAFPLVFIVLYSCSTSKNIPEGEYLLNSVNIKADNKSVDKTAMASYLRQEPNGSMPLFGKFRLKIYNMAGQDTTKWLTRFVRKIGEPPVLYNAGLTSVSAKNIERQLINQGFLNAEVDTLLNFDKQKITVTYDVKAGIPYTIRKYEFDSLSIPTQFYRPLTMSKRRSEIRPGSLFDQEQLEEERTNISDLLRNIGYYAFSKESLYYQADTTLGTNQVDLFLSVYPPTDSTTFSRYNIRNTTITSGYDPMDEMSSTYFAHPDTAIYYDVKFIHGSNNFLKKSTLLRNTLLRPGSRYSDRAFSRTYSAFNTMSSVKQTNITITPVSESLTDSIQLLDVNISIVPGNMHRMQISFDGTHTEGDIGIAPNISYQHQNFFNGSEVLSLKLKGALEFITGDKNTDVLNQNFYEYGFDVGLSFPQFIFPFLKKSWRELPSASTQFSVGLNNQHRLEYTRQFFNTTVTYRWATQRSRLTHALDILDINYVRMPFVSKKFEDDYLNDSTNTLLRTMYQNQLIARHGYSLVYTKSRSQGRNIRNTSTYRFSFDVGGLLPRLITSFYEAERNENNAKTILGTAYAEYWKTDISFSNTQVYASKNSLAYRIGIGVASPFGNSTVMPFERRYFSGGSNSVRGWSTRRLGPGSYKAQNGPNDFVNQIGDIKLDLNLEYRAKTSEYIEIAGFIDGGNIWTMKNYKEQSGGQFSFSKFYKEIALSYGVGLRFDLSFLLLRLDMGMKAYDPARDEGDRWVVYRPRLSRDFAWHFAIGYPF